MDRKNLSCAQYVKRHGFLSLKEFAQITEFPVSTLQDWYRDRPAQFDVVLRGGIAKLAELEGVVCA